MFLALGATARAQVPKLPSAAPPRDAQPQDPSPALSPAGMPAASFADIVNSVEAIDGLEATPGLSTVPQPSHLPTPGAAPPASRMGMAIFDTITDSILGEPDPNSWRPLPFSTFFSEGWSEAWVPSPRGSGGAPRQGWINALEGTFNRTWLFTFAYGYNTPPKSNAYLGSYLLLTPLSRRLMLLTSIPFVLRNSADSGLPTINPSGQTATTRQSHTGFGDISFTPRVLLHETKDFSLTAEVSVLTPTGNQPLAGKTALTPTIGFWNNFAARWVIRGGIGDLIPLDGGGSNTLISQLAIGQTLTDHDVPWFGDFACYLSAVVKTPLSNGDQTSVTLTPGIRTHLGRDWYFLAGLPTPVTKARVADLGMILWFLKSW
jgi:hypothetical protein